jgi:hypothetical protein
MEYDNADDDDAVVLRYLLMCVSTPLKLPTAVIYDDQKTNLKFTTNARGSLSVIGQVC